MNSQTTVALAVVLTLNLGCGDPLIPGDAAQIKVSAGGKSVVVSLEKLGFVTIGNDRTGAPIDVIWAKVSGEDIRLYQVDFVGADGTRPGSDPACAGAVPVDGAKLSRGCIDVQSRDLTWSSDYPIPSCLFMKNVAELVFTPK